MVSPGDPADHPGKPQALARLKCDFSTDYPIVYLLDFNKKTVTLANTDIDNLGTLSVSEYQYVISFPPDDLGNQATGTINRYTGWMDWKVVHVPQKADPPGFHIEPFENRVPCTRSDGPML
jgi:hypothetical protein